jgi:hypothetical protein
VGKEHVVEIESAVENRIYHESESNKGTFSGDHFASSETKFDERRKNQLGHFFNEIVAEVLTSDELYLFGPSEAKTHLKHKMEEDYAVVASKLKLVETTEALTNNQILAKVKAFYNH